MHEASASLNASGVDDTHAFAATARARLEQYRVADLVGLGMQKIGILVIAVIAGHEGHAGLPSASWPPICCPSPQSRQSEAQRRQHRVSAGLRETFVFREKSIPRMHSLGAGGERGLQDSVRLEVAVACGSAANMHAKIARRDMLCAGIRIRIDRHGPIPSRLARSPRRDTRFRRDWQSAN